MDMSGTGRHEGRDQATLGVISNLPTPGKAIELGVRATVPRVLFRTIAVEVAGATVFRRRYGVRRKFDQVTSFALPTHVRWLLRKRRCDEEMRPLQHDLRPVSGTADVFANEALILGARLVVSTTDGGA